MARFHIFNGCPGIIPYPKGASSGVTSKVVSWGEKEDLQYYLTEFNSSRRKYSEIVLEFNRRFGNLYNRIPADIKPSKSAAKIAFAVAHESDFGLLLRERKSPPLDQMFFDAIDLEGNMLASGTLSKP